MKSDEIRVVKEHWETMAQMPPLPSPTEQRARNDYEWPKLTGEPRGVDVSEITLEGRAALWLVPHGASHEHAIFALHGGGGVGGSVYTHRKMFGHLANAARCRVISVDYRLLPEHAYPAAHDDVFEAYAWLTKQVDPRHIALAGDSFGGGLAVATALRARDAKLPLPAALVLFSPWLDMTVSGETFASNREKDPFFKREVVEMLARMHFGSGDPRDPQLSPLFADLRGLPPTYVQVGGDETLLDESRRFVERAKQVGADVRIDVFPEMLHTFQMAAGRARESDEALHRVGEWLRPKLGLGP
jgi:monoterpene epsilon-lactone hydrolase